MKTVIMAKNVIQNYLEKNQAESHGYHQFSEKTC